MGKTEPKAQFFLWEAEGKQGRGWRIEEICVAEGLEAEICSIRKDELRHEMFDGGWRRKENTCFLPAEMLVCACCSQAV